MIGLLIVSIICASLNGVLLNQSKLTDKSKLFSFNFFVSVLWLLILTIWMLIEKSFTFTVNDAVFGIIYGVVQVLFLVFKSGAMSAGPVSVTSLAANCSLFLSTILGIVIWQESISEWQIAGLVVLVVSVIMTVSGKGDKKITKSWAVLTVFFFIFSAGVGLVFKAFSKSGAGNPTNMMIIAAATMVVLFLCVNLVENKGLHVKNYFHKKTLLLILICGVFSCIYNKLNIYLAGELDSIIFFPSFNGGVLCLSSILGVIILKEKMNWVRVTGLVLGLCSIIMIGVLGS